MNQLSQNLNGFIKFSEFHPSRFRILYTILILKHTNGQDETNRCLWTFQTHVLKEKTLSIATLLQQTYTA